MMDQRPGVPPDSELWSLVAAQCDGTMTTAMGERLSRLLCDDPNARALYVLHMDQHAALLWRYRDEPIDASVAHELEDASAFSMGLPVAGREAFGSPLFDAVGYFSSGWPAAYLTASVILVIGLALGSLWHTPRSDRVASLPAASDRQEIASVRDRDVVGRITAAVDCRWSKDSMARGAFDVVTIGRQLDLESGIAEITYDTGARVILQAPCTYRVDSKASGFLSLGKLTACVEKNTDGEKDRGEDAEKSAGLPSPSTADNALFAIKTPTATITDLGTEFGVEVTKSGRVSAHVFRGLVDFQSNSGDRSPLRLSKNQSASLEDGDGQSVRREPAATDVVAFLREAQLSERVEEQKERPFREWQAYSRRLREDPALVAYYTFDGPDGDPSVLANQSAAGRALDGTIHGAEWTAGRFEGKRALRFHGFGTRDHVELPDPARFEFTGPFSVAVWYRVEPNEPRVFEALIAKGDSAWRLQRYDASDSLMFVTTTQDPAVGTTDRDLSPTEDGRWHHNLRSYGSRLAVDDKWHLVVIIGEPDGDVIHKRMYCDGRSMSSSEGKWPMGANAAPVSIGNNGDCPERAFPGLIDEVAILSRAMTATEVAEMYKMGRPPLFSNGTAISRRR